MLPVRRSGIPYNAAYGPFDFRVPETFHATTAVIEFVLG
jgi:hypothetical protein